MKITMYTLHGMWHSNYEDQSVVVGISTDEAGLIKELGKIADNKARDYLEMCVKQKYYMRNSFVLYPKDLQKSHDKVAHRIRMKADAKMRRDFKKAYLDIAGQMDFEMDGMKILYPATPDEIISEGNTLHHCVGGYVDRVARKECVILFLRQCAEESKSFYTIEVREREVVQVRCMKNDPPTPKVKKFM